MTAIESRSGHRTPGQIAQESEARGRNTVRDEAGQDIGPDPVQTALNDSTEELGGDPPARQIEHDSDEGADRGKVKPIHMSPADQKRAEFAKRFKRDDDGDVPYNGDANDPEMLYGKFGRDEPESEPQPEPQARVEPEPQAEKKFTIKVRGKELQLTEAELLERASKVEAADTYLEESKDLLKQATEARRNNNAERTGDEPHRPEARTSTQDDGLDRDLATEGDQRPDPLVQAIEEIQFGDPKEAAPKLRKALEIAADENAAERERLNRITADSAASRSAVAAFVDQNPEFKDPRTERWMRDELFQIQREEIIALGQARPEEIPTDGKTIANWHQIHRTEGHNVSDPISMLNKAKERYDAWRGVAPKPAAQQPQAQTHNRREAPRVEVNVDRNARRAAIPSQPSRPSAPVPDAVQQRPQASNRSNTIANMRAARGQLVG